MKGGIIQHINDHPASILINELDEIDDFNASCVRRKPLPNDCPDLLNVSVTNDHQIGSFNISFGHENSRGHVAYHLEKGSVLVDLRRELLTIVSDNISQMSPKKHSRILN